MSEREPLRVLVLEDSDDDYQLVIRELRRGGFDPAAVRVDSEGSMHRALLEDSWDVVISDHAIPSFGSHAALRLVRGIDSDLPFIIVSGMIGEEEAAAAMRGGAHDYVMKGNLKRLTPAIRRELAEASVRRRNRVAQDRARARSLSHGRQQAAIAQFGQLAVSVPARALLDNACTLVSAALGIDACALFEIVPGGNRLTITASSGFPASPDRTVDAVGHLAAALREPRPVVFDRLAGDRALLHGETFGALPITSCAAVAIPGDEGPFAVLAAYSFPHHDFSPEETDFLQSITNILAQALRREAAEIDLRRREEHFRALIENASDMILIMEHDGAVSYASPSLQKNLGFSIEDLKSLSIFDLVHEDDVGEVVRAFSRCIGDPESTTPPVGFRFRHRSGEWRTLEAVAKSMLANPAVAGVVVNLRDITERTLLESQLEQAHRINSLGRLAATVAHEFNNVLMGIRSFASALHSRVTDPESISHVRYIEQAVQRGQRVTEEILRFTHTAEPLLVPVDVRGWIDDFAPEVRQLAGPLIRVETDVRDETLWVMADSGQLTQIFTNIALNAKDAMSGGGTLTIEAEESTRGSYPFGVIEDPRAYIHFAVRDSGTGIAEHAIPYVFDPLYTTKQHGTGLGLPIARQMVVQHGGQIFVESVHGQGTTVHVFLPKAGARSDGANGKPTPGERPDGSQPARIVLVEDDPIVWAGIESLLVSKGIEVEVVEEGLRAEEVIERMRPDAVVLDVGLPDIDGLDLYQAIARRWPELPVVFSSGSEDALRIERLASRPNTASLRKPYDLDQLLTALNRVTGRNAPGG